jgi:hypothetical protein
MGESNEITTYRGSIAQRMLLLRHAVDGLDAEQLNSKPQFAGANSIWVLATHALGNARAWILGIACGRDMSRDRPSEFASSGKDAAQLIAAIERTQQDVDAALRELDPSRLGVRFVPPQDLWGEGAPRETSVRDAIVQVIEHMSHHLGHIDIVRSMAQSR